MAEPILELLIKDVAPVQVELAIGGKYFELDFDVGMIQRKLVALKKKFNKVKSKHDVRSYFAKGETASPTKT